MEHDQNSFPDSDQFPKMENLRAPDSLLPAVLARLGLGSSRLSGKAPLEALLRALHDPEWQVRVAALHALGALDEEAPLEALVARLHDEAWQVRNAAVQVLGELRARTPLEPLAESLHDEAWQVRTAAVQALGELAERVPFELLIVDLNDEDTSVRVAATQALGRLGERVSVNLLLAALQDTDWLVRQAAAMVLGEMGARAPIAPLIAALHDENACVSQAARLALEQTHPEVLPPDDVMASQRRYASAPYESQRVRPALLEALYIWREKLFLRRQKVNEEDAEGVTFVSLAYSSGAPRTRQRGILRRRLFFHIVEGGLAALFVASLIIAWFALAQRFHPLSLGHHSSQHGAAILFTYQGGQGVEGYPVWSPDSQSIAFMSSFGYSVQVLNVATGNMVQNPLEPVPYTGLNTASAASWSPDGKYLAITSEDISSHDALLQVWNVLNGNSTMIVHSHANGLLYSAWSFDGTRIAFVGNDGKVQIGDPLTGHVILTFAGHAGNGLRLIWSADNQLLLLSSPDGTFQLWSTITGRNISTFHGATLTYFALSPDGHYLVSRGDGGTLQVWDTASGRMLGTHNGPAGGTAFLEWSPDSERILTDSDNQVQIWDAKTGGTILTFSHPSLNSLFQLSPDSRHLFTANDSEVQFWNAVTGHTILTFPDPASSGTWQLSPDGRYVAFDSGDNTIQVWDAVTGHKVASYRGHTAQVQTLAWSPDSQRLVSASEDGTVQVWDADSGSNLITYHGLLHLVTLTWSPNGQFIICTSEDNTMHVLQAN